jgi:hypothetical protein
MNKRSTTQYTGFPIYIILQPTTQEQFSRQSGPRLSPASTCTRLLGHTASQVSQPVGSPVRGRFRPKGEGPGWTSWMLPKAHGRLCGQPPKHLRVLCICAVCAILLAVPLTMCLVCPWFARPDEKRTLSEDGAARPAPTLPGESP